MGQSKGRVFQRLFHAEAKFTKAKESLDGTDLAEARYQRAKRQLAAARKAAKRFPQTPQTGDAVAHAQPVTGTLQKGDG